MISSFIVEEFGKQRRVVDSVHNTNSLRLFLHLFPILIEMELLTIRLIDLLATTVLAIFFLISLHRIQNFREFVDSLARSREGRKEKIREKIAF